MHGTKAVPLRHVGVRRHFRTRFRAKTSLEAKTLEFPKTLAWQRYFPKIKHGLLATFDGKTHRAKTPGCAQGFPCASSLFSLMSKILSFCRTMCAREEDDVERCVAPKVRFAGAPVRFHGKTVIIIWPRLLVQQIWMFQHRVPPAACWNLQAADRRP